MRDDFLPLSHSRRSRPTMCPINVGHRTFLPPRGPSRVWPRTSLPVLPDVVGIFTSSAAVASLNCSGVLRSSRTSTDLPGSDCVFNASMRLAGLAASCFQASLSLVISLPDIAAVSVVVASTNVGATQRAAGPAKLEWRSNFGCLSSSTFLT